MRGKLVVLAALSLAVAGCDQLQPVTGDDIIEQAIAEEPWMAPLYEAFEEEFPAEFDDYKQQLLAQARSGATESDAYAFGRQFMLRFMAENAANFGAAPQEELFAVRDASLRVIELLAAEDVGFCANYTMTGLQEDDHPDRRSSAMLGQATALQLRAVAAGKRNPVQRDPASEADFLAFADALEAQGLTPFEVDDLLGGGSGIVVNGAEYQCRAGLAIHRSLVEMPDDISARLSVMLLNPAG